MLDNGRCALSESVLADCADDDLVVGIIEKDSIHFERVIKNRTPVFPNQVEGQRNTKKLKLTYTTEDAFTTRLLNSVTHLFIIAYCSCTPRV
jgi:hypothetical protein